MTIPHTPRDLEDFDLMYAAKVLGGISAADWEIKLRTTPGLYEYIEELEQDMRRAGI